MYAQDAMRDRSLDRLPQRQEDHHRSSITDFNATVRGFRLKKEDDVS